MKKMTEEELVRYMTEETKGEKAERIAGSFFRHAVLLPCSVFCGLFAVVCRIVGKISCILFLPGIYYAYKTYAAVRAGEGLFYGGYFSIAASFLIFPFAAYTVSFISDKVKELLRQNVF